MFWVCKYAKETFIWFESAQLRTQGDNFVTYNVRFLSREVGQAASDFTQ